jgi:hypothetical protein
VDFAEPGREDDQCLPAARKVRRVSATDRGESFLGSDLSYEDVKLETQVGLDDYRWTTLGEDEVDARPCLVVEAVPVDEKTARELGYGRVLLSVDAELSSSPSARSCAACAERRRRLARAPCGC